MIAGADEIVAALPAKVVELLAQPGASVAQTDGTPLPGWIAHDAQRGALATRAVPRDALPLRAVLGAAGTRVAVTMAPPQAMAGR